MPILQPEGKQSFTDSAGAPLAGGRLYTYAAGTTTPKATYADAAGLTPNANPVVLDARGEATIYWDGIYKVVLQDASGVTLWTQDNVGAEGPEGALAALAARLDEEDAVVQVASATNIDLGAAAGRHVDITGTTTIASFGTAPAGTWRMVRFLGVLTLTHSAQLALPGTQSIVTAAGDTLIARSLGAGSWVVEMYQRAANRVPSGDVVLYTPEWNIGHGSVIGNGSISGRYVLSGRMCTVWIELRLGSTSDPSSGTSQWSFSLPLSSGAHYTYGHLRIFDADAGSYQPGFCLVPTYSNHLVLYSMSGSVTATDPITFVDDDQIFASVTYPVG